MIVEHSLVVLDCESPHAGLTRGDGGTIVHIDGGGRDHDVDFVDGSGHTVALINVNADSARPIATGELLHARWTA